MADKIVLDRETFKTLASETRLGLLKSLDGKEVNLSDLSREMEMNKATLLEHLNIMIGNDLVKRVEKEGRKFVYYKLTYKGSGILHPERTWVTVMLGGAVMALAGGIWSMLSYMNPVAPAPELGAPAMKSIDAGSAPAGTQAPVMMYVSIALFAVCVALIIFAAWIRKRKRLEVEKTFAEKINNP